jgi:hypothetical protein
MRRCVAARQAGPTAECFTAALVETMATRTRTGPVRAAGYEPAAYPHADRTTQTQPLVIARGNGERVVEIVLSHKMQRSFKMKPMANPNALQAAILKSWTAPSVEWGAGGEADLHEEGGIPATACLGGVHVQQPAGRADTVTRGDPYDPRSRPPRAQPGIWQAAGA